MSLKKKSAFVLLLFCNQKNFLLATKNTYTYQQTDRLNHARKRSGKDWSYSRSSRRGGRRRRRRRRRNKWKEKEEISRMMWYSKIYEGWLEWQVSRRTKRITYAAHAPNMRCMCHTKRICCACAIYSSASGAQSKPHAQRMHHICYICTSCVTQSESCMQCMCYIKQCIWRSKHIMYLRIHHKKWSLSHACTACDAQSKSCTHFFK